MKKRLLALLLCVLMVWTLPAEAFAAVRGQASGKVAPETAESDAAYELLDSLGLLDEGGELDMNGALLLDGEELTLAELTVLLEDPETDMTRTAQVDGADISLADLKKMLEIEEQLDGIRRRYFSGAEMTSEQLAAVDDLARALENGEVRLLGTTPRASSEAPLVLDLSALESSTTFAVDGVVTGMLERNTTFTRNVVCADCITVPAGRKVSFRFGIDHGTLPDNYNLVKYKLEGFDNAACNGTAFRTLELPYYGGIDADIFEIDNSGGTRELKVTLRVTITKSVSTDTGSYSWRLSSMLDENYGGDIQGTLRGYLTFSDPSGCVFKSGATEDPSQAYIYQKAFTLDKTYAIISVYEGTLYYYSWKTFIYDDGPTIGVDTIEDGGSYLTTQTAIWPVLINNVASLPPANPTYSIKESDINALFFTAQRVQGGTGAEGENAPWFNFEIWSSLLHTDSDTTNGAVGPWQGMVPVPVDISGNTLTYQNYNIGRGENVSSVTDANISTRLYYGFPHSEIVDNNPLSIPYANYKTVHRTDGSSGWNRSFMICQGLPYAMKMWGAPKEISLEGCNTIATNQIRATVTNSFGLSVYDVTAPTVESVEVLPGSYVSGQLVPITITFSEPVVSENCKVKINGTEYDAAALLMDTSGRTAVAWYKVKDIDTLGLYVNYVTGIKDLCGNTTATDDNNGSGWQFADVSLLTARMRTAVESLAAQYDAAAHEALITVGVKQDEAYKNKYMGTPKNAYNSFEAVVTDEEGKSQTVELELCENVTTGELYYAGRMSTLVLEADERAYSVGVRAFESAEDTGTFLSAGAGFTVPAKVNVALVSVSSDDEDVRTLTISEEYRPKLTAALSPDDASYGSGRWTSSDEKIATVEPVEGKPLEAQVTLTGTKIGEVTFTFTADNGTPDVSSDDVSDSITYTVEAGESVALVIPSNASVIPARKNEKTRVIWSSNAELLGGNALECTVAVYAGNHAGAEELEALTAVWEGQSEAGANTLDIPVDILSELSQGRTPAYTVLISADHPLIEGAVLRAVAHIIVNPAAAKVRITPPASTGITDGQTAAFSWSIDNFITEDASQTDATLKIIRVKGDSDEEEFLSMDVNSATGSYTLTPKPVPAGSLKETYMVTLSAKNQGDEAAHFDSFPLYVYNGEALKLQYEDGSDVGESFTLDNTAIVSGYTAQSQSAENTSGTEELLELRKELGLIEYVSINYGDYSWSQIYDRIRWETSNDDVMIGFKQGALYEDIDLFGYEDFLPQTLMSLSSVADGTATITATHAATGMTADVQVNVSTLRKEFYLFQFTPAIQTKLTYTDGAGVEKSVLTNSEGVLALYEPEGIAGDVSLKSVSATGGVYLGTIYGSNLLSGERDATLLQLYPLNTFKLRQVARVELSLTKPDGSPFSGTLTLRGGVYKNGEYCQSAEMSGVGTDYLRDGKTSQTVTVNKGKLTVSLDSTQFWSESAGETSADAAGLSTSDNIQYIFELSGIAGDDYLPMLVYVDGNLMVTDVMRSGESVLTLEDAFDAGLKKPFLSNQFIDYGLSAGRLIDVRGSTGFVGPSATYPNAKLVSIALLWGETSAEGCQLLLCDEFFREPPEQTVSELTYPFSSIPAVMSTVTLSEETMTDSGWIADGESMGLRRLIVKNGDVISNGELPFRAIDLTRVEGVEWSDTARSLVTDVADAMAMPDIDMSGSGVSGKILEFVVKTLDGSSGPLDTPVVKMLITPGADNSIFNAFVWAGYNGTGLSEANYTNGIAVDTATYQPSLGLELSKDSVKSMAEGKYFTQTNLNDSFIDGLEKPGRADVGAKFQVEGYYEFELRYDPELGEWTAQTLGGGFTAGIGINANYKLNGFAGPVPLTAEFNFKGIVQLQFKAATVYTADPDAPWLDPDAGSVTDFLTTLRAYAYVDAFGGFGFDYTLLALKVGLYGSLTVDNNNRFLSREYLKDESQRQLNGQQLYVKGEVGIRFVAKFLLFSYEATLGSAGLSGAVGFNDWDKIDEYWAGGETISALMSAYAQQTGLQVTGLSAGLTSREYLTADDRNWYGGGYSAPKALDETSAVSALQTNANPDSLPLVSDDGQLLLYVSDGGSESVYDSRVYAGALQGGTYTQGAAVPDPMDFSGAGDSSLSLDGSSSFAAAAWVRLSERVPNKDAGDQLTTEEIALMSGSAEVVASVWNGTGWSSTRLTENTIPDLAPAVAVSGDRALVVWRSVFAADPDDATDFSAYDTIEYSVYSAADGWSEPARLYNGSTGSVTGLRAAMLSDGTAAVVYALQRDDGDAATADSEIAYTIINTGAAADDRQVVSMLATSDSRADEDPQVTTAVFAPGDERFVLAWYSTQNGEGDVRLLAVDGDGGMSNDFPASLAQVTGASAAKSGGIGFARTTGAVNTLENLTFIYTEALKDESGYVDHSSLNAVRLRLENGAVAGFAAPSEIAELPARTLLDHADAYVTTGGDVRAVLQGTWYDPVNVDDLGAPLEKTQLFTASGVFRNTVEVTRLAVDYANLSAETLTPIQLTVTNTGLGVITGVDVTLGGKTYTFDNMDLVPNDSAVLTCTYNTGAAIADLPYTLTADFAGGGTSPAVSGTVYLDYPDVGVSRMELVSEGDGLRTLRLTLYNSAAATLAGNKDRSVRLGFYTDSALEAPAAVTCTAPGVTAEGKELVISGEDALALIDAGGYTLEVTYNVGAQVSSLGLEEIPDAGLRLYARAWGAQGDRSDALPEYDSTDNGESILFDSLLKRSGEAVSTGVEQWTAGTVTTAEVSVRNNSLQGVTNGAAVAMLLDADGDVLESVRLSLPDTLTSEQTAKETVNFTRAGSRVTVTYGVEEDVKSAALSALRFDGLAVELSDFVANGAAGYTASLTDVTETSTLVSFVTESPTATVTINGESAESGTRVRIPFGSSEIVLRVTDGDESAVYTLNLTGITVDDSRYFTVRAQANAGGTVSPGGSISVKEGQNKTFSILPDAGYKLVDVFADGVSVLSELENGQYTFEAVSAAHTLRAVFMDETWNNPFKDTEPSDWFFMDVMFARANGIMVGTGEETFDPNTYVTRAMAAATLWRIAGAQTVAVGNPFRDVAEDSWYTDAVLWAAENKIMSGYGGGLFGPEDPITREQFAAILYRFAGSLNNYAPSEGVLDGFTDKDEISRWAVASMEWAVYNGILAGRGNGILDPGGFATRAEMAAVLHRAITAFDLMTTV